MAIFVHNNAYDTILLANSEAYLISEGKEVAEFILAGDGIKHWSGTKYWEGEDISNAAEAYGETLAYINKEGNLIIVEEKAWKERCEFYDVHRFTSEDNFNGFTKNSHI